jgi:hypothetical protein
MNYGAITYLIDSQHEISFYSYGRVLVAYSGATECEPIYVTNNNLSRIEEPLDFSNSFGSGGVVDYPVINRRTITGSVQYYTSGAVSSTVLEHFSGTVFPTLAANGLNECVFCVFTNWSLLSEYIEASLPTSIVVPGVYYADLTTDDITSMHNIGREQATMFVMDVHSSTRWHDIVQTTIYRGSPYLVAVSGKLAFVRPFIRNVTQPTGTLQSYLSVPLAALMADNTNHTIVNQHIPSYRNDSEYAGREYSNSQKRLLKSAGINTARTAHLADNNAPGQVMYSVDTLSDNLVMASAKNVLVIHQFAREIQRALRDPTYLGLSGLPKYTMNDVTRMSAGGSSYIDFSVLGRNKPLLGSPINITNVSRVTKAVIESYPLLDQSFSVSQEIMDTIKIEVTMRFFGNLDYITISFQARSA